MGALMGLNPEIFFRRPPSPPDPSGTCDTTLTGSDHIVTSIPWRSPCDIYHPPEIHEQMTQWNITDPLRTSGLDPPIDTYMKISLYIYIEREIEGGWMTWFLVGFFWISSPPVTCDPTILRIIFNRKYIDSNGWFSMIFHPVMLKRTNSSPEKPPCI